VSTGRARPAPALRPALSLSEAALLEALAALAGAGSCLDVCEALCGVLLDLDGVRAAAVLQRRHGDAVVVGSAGYGCDTMGAGSRLPLDSGLPAAEAIRTGLLVQQGDGPAWCALPFGRRTAAPGALLLSLTTGPATDPSDLVRLQRLATALGAALARAARSDRTAEDLSTVIAGLTPQPAADEAHSAVRQISQSGPLGGDVALALPDGHGGRWLVAADVSGSGLAAAGRAAAVRVAVGALAPSADGPAQLLELLDRTLRPQTPDGGFVTAVVVHARDGLLRAASAGHPAPFLLVAGVAAPLELEPGQPLALETTELLPAPVEVAAHVPAGAMVVLYSDGLIDRRGPDRAELDIQVLVNATAGLTTPAAVAAALIDAADAAGPADDDTSVLASLF
jgi:hypothetical protein